MRTLSIIGRHYESPIRHMRSLQMPSLLDKSERLRALRAQAAFHGRQHAFDRSMRKLLREDGRRIPDAILAALYANWGDPLTQNDEVYLRSCLAEAAVAEGAILQCGTSLMTLLLGTVCDRADSESKHVWCLEHDEHWANVMRSWLTEYRIQKAHMISARAEMFEGYAWYGINTDRLAKKYSLVICEGARATPSGVIGAIKQIDARLAKNFVILARNISKPGELKFLAAWAKAKGASFALVDKSAGFVKLSLQSRTRKTAAPQTASKAGSQNPRPPAAALKAKPSEPNGVSNPA